MPNNVHFAVSTHKDLTIYMIHVHPEMTMEISRKKGKLYARIVGAVEGLEVLGWLDGAIIRVERVEYGGERSGTFFEDFINMLASGTGEFRGIAQWESGDFERVTIINGQVKTELVSLAVLLGVDDDQEDV